MRLPTWDELAAEPEQLEVLEYPLDQSLFVVGPPGSGKTVLAVRRARSAAQVGDVSSVAIVTFNRMLRRLLNLIGEDGAEEPLVDGSSDPEAFTMHSFVSRDYRGRTGFSPPNVPHDQYAYDWGAMSERLREHAHASTDKEHLDKEHLDKEHLVVDEGQDLPEGFFGYAAHVSNVMTVFADEDQAVGDRSTTLEQIKRAAGLSDPMILTRNHRNTPRSPDWRSISTAAVCPLPRCSGLRRVSFRVSFDRGTSNPLPSWWRTGARHAAAVWASLSIATQLVLACMPSCLKRCHPVASICTNPGWKTTPGSTCSHPA